MEDSLIIEPHTMNDKKKIKVQNIDNMDDN